MVSIAFDPGTNHTGYCVFEQGKVIDIESLKVPVGLNFETKLLRQKGNIYALLGSYGFPPGPGIAAIAIEDWQGGSWSNDSSMRRCWAIRGMLICLADDFCQTIQHVNKKTIKKTETEMLAKAYGIPTKGKPKTWHNALDAFQIGICAGFDRS